MDTTQLQQIRIESMEIPRLKERSSLLYEEIVQLEDKYIRLHQIYEEEKIDVKRLEKESLSTIIYRIVGKLDEKMDKEEKEMLQAKAILVDCSNKLELLRNEKTVLDLKLIELNNNKLSYDRKIKELRNNVKIHLSTYGFEEYTNIENEIAEYNYEIVEIKQAIDAAKEVFLIANEAKTHLNNAQKLATVDVFLKGGFITDMLKYDHIDKAEKSMSQLELGLKRLKKELVDVNTYVEYNTRVVASGQRFTDLVFDNIFTDLSVKNKIESNKEEMNVLMKKMDTLMEDLSNRIRRLERQIQGKQKGQEHLLIGIRM